MNRILKHLLISFALVASSLFAVAQLSTPVSANATGGECDDNAVVRCGIYSVEALRSHYKGDVKAAYNHFGISTSMIDGSGATIRNGHVNKNGDVVLDGKVIATGAITAGRQNIPGSTKFTAGGSTFYERPSTVSFISRDVFEAYIMVDKDGAFLGAVLKPCGNPVKAKPKVVKKPAATCSSVTAHKLSRTSYRFTGQASTVDGATISSYSFVITGPNTNRTVPVNTTSRSATTPTVSLTEAGTYAVTLTVKTSVGDRTGANCKTTFTVDKEPETPAPAKTVVCNPANGQTITVDEKDADKYKPVGDEACQPKVESVKVEKIAETGATDYLMGATGLGSLTAAGYYLRASRQRLLVALKK